MFSEFLCPVCGADSWAAIEEITFSAKDHKKTASKLARKLDRYRFLARALFLAKPRGGSWGDTILDSYHVSRRKVLFDVWFPGQAQVSLKVLNCHDCGFMTFSPRPSNRDIGEKYGYINSKLCEAIGDSGTLSRRAEYESMRAARIYRAVMRQQSKKRLRVLDFGGANGEMLIPFMANGHEAFLIDYCDKPISGVIKLGDSIEDVDCKEKYDVILCNHVLEHVSEPGDILAALSGMLAEEGILYAEVPDEVWMGIGRRIGKEPVTHINYFTKNSFTRLIASNGFSVVESVSKVSNHGKNFKSVLIVMAEKSIGSAPVVGELEGGYDTMHLLYPSRFFSMKKIVLPIVYSLKHRYFMPRDEDVYSSKVYGNDS